MCRVLYCIYKWYVTYIRRRLSGDTLAPRRPDALTHVDATQFAVCPIYLRTTLKRTQNGQKSPTYIRYTCSNFFVKLFEQHRTTSAAVSSTNLGAILILASCVIHRLFCFLVSCHEPSFVEGNTKGYTFF